MGKKHVKKRLYRHHVHPLKGHPFVVPVLTLIGLVIITLVGLVSFNATTLRPTDSRVVHVYADNQERTLPTRAKNVGELLDRLDIEVREGDIVEPGLDTQILEDDFSINVYRARPVTIIDGDKRTTVFSAQQSPQALAREAGLELYPEDEIIVSAPTDIIDGSVVAEEVTLQRSIPIKLVLFGQPIDIRTHAKTVKELITDNHLDLENITVLPPPDTLLKANDVVFVTSPDKNLEIVEEIIEMPTETILDPTLPINTTQIRTQGAPGRRVVIYEVDKDNPSIRVALQEIIAAAPIRHVVVRGTKVALTGNKVDWMNAAGINPADYVFVDYIIGRESGWNPGAVSASRCIGLGQRCNAQILVSACPNWQSDPVCQLQHFSGYAHGRYGDWQRAYNFWQANHWW